MLDSAAMTGVGATITLGGGATQTLDRVAIYSANNFFGSLTDLGSGTTLVLNNSTSPLTIGGNGFMSISNVNLPNGGAIIYDNGPGGRGFFQGFGTATGVMNVDLGNTVDLAIPSGNNMGFDVDFSDVSFSGAFMTKSGNGIARFSGTLGGIVAGIAINEGTVTIGASNTDFVFSKGISQINSTGILNGFGTFGNGESEVDNLSGLLNPGDKDNIGTLTIAGSYVQKLAGTFLIKALNGINADKLVVDSGTVTLDGLLIFETLPEGSFNPGDQIVIIDNSTGSAPISGQFTGFFPNLPPNVKAKVVYNPQQVIIKFTPACPVVVNPPYNLRAKQIANQFLLQEDLINRLTWHASPSPNVTAYHVFRNGKLIGTVCACDPLVFDDHNRQKGQSYRYSVTAVLGTGEESEPIALRFPK